MTAALPKSMPDTLRVLIVAADDKISAALMRIVRGAGHIVAPMTAQADVILAHGVAPHYDLPVVGLGLHNERAQGQLPSDATPAQIDAALRAVAAGLHVASPAATEQSFQALDEHEQVILLTPRETEVLMAVAEGLSNKEIARELRISLHTVKFHLESLMRKIGASSRTEAVSQAMRLKLLKPFSV